MKTDTRILCQACRHYLPWVRTYEAPKCPNPDGMVHTQTRNNCSFFKARSQA